MTSNNSFVGPLVGWISVGILGLIAIQYLSSAWMTMFRQGLENSLK